MGKLLTRGGRLIVAGRLCAPAVQPRMRARRQSRSAPGDRLPPGGAGVRVGVLWRGEDELGPAPLLGAAVHSRIGGQRGAPPCRRSDAVRREPAAATRTALAAAHGLSRAVAAVALARARGGDGGDLPRFPAPGSGPDERQRVRIGGVVRDRRHHRRGRMPEPSLGLGVLHLARAAADQARNAALAATTAAKSEFLANMSHEIRTPLTRSRLHRRADRRVGALGKSQRRRPGAADGPGATVITCSRGEPTSSTSLASRRGSSRSRTCELAGCDRGGRRVALLRPRAVEKHCAGDAPARRDSRGRSTPIPRGCTRSWSTWRATRSSSPSTAGSRCVWSCCPRRRARPVARDRRDRHRHRPLGRGPEPGLRGVRARPTRR